MFERGTYVAVDSHCRRNCEYIIDSVNLERYRIGQKRVWDYTSRLKYFNEIIRNQGKTTNEIYEEKDIKILISQSV